MRKKFDLSAAMDAVETPEVEQLTFGELLRGYCAVAGRDPNDALRLRKWISAFGTRSAWEITGADLTVAVIGMVQSKEYKAATVNRDLASIGSAYKWAITEKRVAPLGFISPTIGVKRADASGSIRRIFIDSDKMQALRDLALIRKGNTDRRFGLFVHLLADTGARKSELYERTWADLNLERREILLHDSKTGEPRVLHFSPATARLIARICPTRKPELMMFPGKVASEPINYRSAWTRLTKEAGLPGLHMHDLRHDRARTLLVEGTPVALAASLMGHSVEMLTRRYGHIALTDQKIAVEKTWRAAA
jgi:integrase